MNSTTVIYSCDVGYSIDGNVVRSCQEDGFGWSGSDPSCGESINICSLRYIFIACIHIHITVTWWLQVMNLKGLHIKLPWENNVCVVLHSIELSHMSLSN